MSRTVLAIGPHPDDIEFYAGGTLAKLVGEGCRAIIVIATDGSKGSYEHSAEDLVDLRREEAMRAAAVMGADPPIMLGYKDYELDRLPAGVLREQIICLIRKHRPDILIAEDILAADEVHPDHRAVAWAVSDAVNSSFLPLAHPEHREEGLLPHFVVEKYFYGGSATSINRVVDITLTFERKIAGLAQHRSQVEFLVEDLFMQARLAGLDPAAVLGQAVHNPQAALTWAMRAQAVEAGRSAGYDLGEAFRYVRFHPFIENVLASYSQK